jgi:hypothetical protein
MKEGKKLNIKDSSISSRVSLIIDKLLIGQHEEWISKDLVVDTRETWKKWFNR